MILRGLLSGLMVMGLAMGQGTPSFLPPGAIVSVGTQSDAIAVMPSGGGLATCYAPNLGDDPNVVLWDPANPDDLILGGDAYPTGYLSRMSFVSATSFTLTPIVPATGAAHLQRPEQLSWSQTGQQIVVADSLADGIITVDPATGVETLVVSGSAYWSGSVSAGAQHPQTGDYYVGTTQGEIWRISGTGTALQVVPFQSFAAQGAIRKILFDDQFGSWPGSPNYLVFSQSDRVRRIDLVQPTIVTQTFATGITGNVNSLAFDAQGDIVFGVDTQHTIWRIPNQASDPLGAAVPTIVGNIPCLGYPHRDVAVVGSTTRPFRLTLQSLPFGSGIIAIDDFPANAFQAAPLPGAQGWLCFSRFTSLPAGSGPFFGLVPDALTLFVLGQPGIPGGLLHFAAGAPPAFTTASPFFIPPGSMSPVAGETWDGVVVVFDAYGQFLGKTNVARVTWQ